jgi:hypothetical protein
MGAHNGEPCKNQNTIQMFVKIRSVVSHIRHGDGGREREDIRDIHIMDLFYKAGG